MLNFETQILSKETIKPSSPEIHKKEPFKIGMYDQLTPTTYFPVIAFYASSHHTNLNNTTNILTRLKTSLSKTLNILYPFSGRIYDNMFIHDFDAGALFFSARTGVRLSEFLKHHQLESLNKLLPCQPFSKELNDEVPLIVCQVTVFECGGIALGICGSHKLVDAYTGFVFCGLWSKICKLGSHHGIEFPNLSKASSIFPPKNPMPKNYISLMENLWFMEANYMTRKFVFNAEAIAILKGMAKGEEAKMTPTRVEVVSCFIWKCSMAASRAVGGTLKPSIAVQVVNMRPRLRCRLDGSLGNVFWWASAISHPEKTDTQLSDLVESMSESIAVFDDDYLRSVQGEQGFEAMSDNLNQLEIMFSDEKPDIFAFTSWLGFDYSKLDFGWGEPCSFGLCGKVGPAFRNLTYLVKTKDGKGIEAWITLDKMRMSALEKDPEFLKFASPNLMISSL